MSKAREMDNSKKRNFTSTTPQFWRQKISPNRNSVVSRIILAFCILMVKYYLSLGYVEKMKENSKSKDSWLQHKIFSLNA